MNAKPPEIFSGKGGFIRQEKPYIFQTQEELMEWANQSFIANHSLFSYLPYLPYAFSVIFDHYCIPYGKTSEEEEGKNGKAKSTVVEITSSVFDGLSFAEMQKKFYELTELDFTDITYEKIKELEKIDK